MCFMVIFLKNPTSRSNLSESPLWKTPRPLKKPWLPPSSNPLPPSALFPSHRLVTHTHSLSFTHTLCTVSISNNRQWVWFTNFELGLQAFVHREESAPTKPWVSPSLSRTLNLNLTQDTLARPTNSKFCKLFVLICVLGFRF